jgi:N-dimethylarginine dimethylaminohydrolase
MSPPPPSWRIRGGANYRSVSRKQVNPRRALAEWLALADAIEATGAVVNVVPYPRDVPEPLTGLMYTANAGWLRAPSRFRVARLTVAHRQAEREYLSGLFSVLFGWQVEESGALWEGQADMCRLSDAMVLLSYGVRSTRESVDEIASLLPPSQDHRSVQLREPFFHGDTCMNVLAGSTPLFLVLPSAFATQMEYRKARDAASAVAEILEITEADALAYACNSLGLGDEILIPTGLSDGLRRMLSERGYRLRQLDFTELFGKGGGGPRCLVNDLGSSAPPPTASRYGELRAALHAMLEDYPTAEPS